MTREKTTILAAIGDLHGHAPALESLLAALERRGGFFASPGRLERGAKLVLTGDYIDRGSRALPAIEHLRALQAANPGRVITLLGNHELLALQCLDEARALSRLEPDEAFEQYRLNDHGGNGGCAFIREFGEADGTGAFATYARRMARDGDIGAWIRALEPFHSARVAGKRFLFSHADVPEALLADQALGRYGMDISFRMQARSDDMGGAELKYGNRVFTSSQGSLFWCRDFRRLVGARREAIARICERANTDFIVTGHTMHPGKVVAYGDRIIDIDVGMTPTYGGNLPQALIATQRGIAAFDANGGERLLVPFGGLSVSSCSPQ